MKKLLLLFFIISNLSFGQEAAYHLNGISSSLGDDFLSKNNGIYYTSLSWNQETASTGVSISYLPNNGQSGWKKSVHLPTDFSEGQTSIRACNLSDNFIVSIQSYDGKFCSVIKIDYNGSIVWSKLMTYNQNLSYDYGSNSTPLILNNQDEIVISITLYDALLLSKMDINGNLIFSKRINSSDYINNGDKNPGFSVITTNDNGYLLTMKNGSNPTITKLNSNLQIVWSKKWSIDFYSHPKIAAVLPNGNYCIIGEGDQQTYIAQVDPNGNLLSYKYNIELSYPYQCRIIDADSIGLVDAYGTNLKINLINNTVSSTKYNNDIQIHGYPNYTDQKINLLDYYISKIYINLESNQMSCFNPTTSYSILSELTVYPSSIVNETIVMENSGTISDYSPTITTTNDVSMTLTCSSLGIDETEVSTLKLYPNPSASGQTITVELEKSSAIKLQLLTLSGKLVESYELNGNSGELTFNTPQESGMYFVQILDVTGNVLVVEKLVVE
ncbi:T9SS type A sorting domain-containing protein [Fluviicola sp.]|uniref:T9SS type A sorting domain-containing protein n=1 Tax=Fluviicola sp. TaxID=1917219 RepID=UPI003D2B3AE8